MKIKVHKNEIICKMKRFENECEKNKQTKTTTTTLQIKKSTKESQQKKPKVTKNDYFSIASSKDEANSQQFWDGCNQTIF